VALKREHLGTVRDRPARAGVGAVLSDGEEGGKYGGLFLRGQVAGGGAGGGGVAAVKSGIKNLESGISDFGFERVPAGAEN